MNKDKDELFMDELEQFMLAAEIEELKVKLAEDVEEDGTLLVKNNSTKDISKCLHISEKTVRNHISNVIQKLDCKNRSCALVELIKLGEITL